MGGLTPVVPGQARVIQLFGKYRGTIREPGLQWVNPFTKRVKVSTRIRNQESAQAKVNDADGNPIEIAAVVVWQVQDTASAVYSVDDFTQFVTIQTETAVRHIASSYPMTTGAAARCRCATTPTRSPTAVGRDRRRGWPRPACTSSSRG
jgi:regulator of protease activity HflC (stomatin/prohibitin superfamily)